MGFSVLGFGPAPIPSRDTDMSSTTLPIVCLLSEVPMRLAPPACAVRGRSTSSSAPAVSRNSRPAGDEFDSDATQEATSAPFREPMATLAERNGGTGDRPTRAAPARDGYFSYRRWWP